MALALGIGLLLIGSVVMPAPDWDMGISFIMAILTYLTAPWLIHDGTTLGMEEAALGPVPGLVHH